MHNIIPLDVCQPSADNSVTVTLTQELSSLKQYQSQKVKCQNTFLPPSFAFNLSVTQIEQTAVLGRLIQTV